MSKTPKIQTPVDKLLQAFKSGKNKLTLEAYAGDLEIFRKFVGARTTEEAISKLLSLAPGEANYLLLTFRDELVNKGLAPATINRKLAAIRSVIKLARSLGLIVWIAELKNVRQKKYRNTLGPGRVAVQRALNYLKSQGGPKSVRDIAIVHLLFTLALRASEIVWLDLDHLKLESKTLSILGKGRAERETLTIPNSAISALKAWIEKRGNEPGPLFWNFDRAKNVSA